MNFPKLDDWGRPVEKLPDCPRCGEDELGVINPACLFCYACGWELWREPVASRLVKVMPGKVWDVIPTVWE
jgi:hypothetical protein